MTKPGKKFWNGRNATSFFSEDIINMITWLSSLTEHLLHWAQPALSAHQSCMALQALLQSLPPLIAEVGVDAVKDDDSRKIIFQLALILFSFLLWRQKRCNMTAMSKQMQIPNSGTPSLKCSTDKNMSTVVLNNWTIDYESEMRVSNKDSFFWKATQLSSSHGYFWIILTSNYLHFYWVPYLSFYCLLKEDRIH